MPVLRLRLRLFLAWCLFACLAGSSWPSSSAAADGWRTHLAAELLPYWTLPAALGVPHGNFPSTRDREGAAQGDGRRWPRMLGRQVFAYAMGFLLTGDPRLLAHAKAGFDWLETRGVDRARGGFHPGLEADGHGVPGVKTAQDLAYAAQGAAAWHFVSRDPAAENRLLAVRALVRGVYWDAAGGRVRDALDDTLRDEVDVGGDGGWELVAQLDQLTGWLLLAQPVMTRPAYRALLLDDARRIGDVIVRRFRRDGIFQGVHDRRELPCRHTDVGHTVKTWWLLATLDARLPERPWRALVARRGPAFVRLAWDGAHDGWYERLAAADTPGPGGTGWWTFAECDQAAALFGLRDPELAGYAARGGARWRRDYVDLPAGEVVPHVDRERPERRRGAGRKANEWKNGFHSVEHALVMYLAARAGEGRPIELYFAVPRERAATFIAVPYLFRATETKREVLDEVDAGGMRLVRVKVTFTGLAM